MQLSKLSFCRYAGSIHLHRKHSHYICSRLRVDLEGLVACTSQIECPTFLQTAYRLGLQPFYIRLLGKPRLEARRSKFEFLPLIPVAEWQTTVELAVCL
jgi:hypothetical protein